MDAPALRTLLRAAAHSILARIYRHGSTPAPGKEAICCDGLRVTISIEPDPRDDLSKIERAALDVLDDKDRKIEELAEAAGYDSVRYFAEAMRSLVSQGLAIKTGVNSFRKN